MKNNYIVGLVLLAALAACKSTPTNPVEGQKLRLITSDQDTTSVRSGTVEFTVTVLDPTGYGVSGAYIDFYDPIEQRARHEGPTPINGEWHVTDTIPLSTGGNTFEFAFQAEHDGAIASDSLKLWVHTIDVRGWAIDSIAANSWDYNDIGVQWSRPAADVGTDTIFVRASNTGGVVQTYLAPYPQNTAMVYALRTLPDTITVHNAFATSPSIVWAPANYSSSITIYENIDSNTYELSGLYFPNGEAVNMGVGSGYRSFANLMLVADPNNHASGVSLISPSLSSLSGFSGGQTTAFYHVEPFIDSGGSLHELYSSNDLSTYVNGSDPVYEIPLPDSSAFSTDFIAVTSDGNYARVAVGPVSHDWSNRTYVTMALSYQSTAGLPYASRPRRHR